jgi:hypothetical protein
VLGTFRRSPASAFLFEAPHISGRAALIIARRKTFDISRTMFALPNVRTRAEEAKHQQRKMQPVLRANIHSGTLTQRNMEERGQCGRFPKAQEIG